MLLNKYCWDDMIRENVTKQGMYHASEKTEMNKTLWLASLRERHTMGIRGVRGTISQRTLLIYLITYLLTHSLNGAQSFLKG